MMPPPVRRVIEPPAAHVAAAGLVQRRACDALVAEAARSGVVRRWTTA